MGTTTRDTLETDTTDRVRTRRSDGTDTADGRETGVSRVVNERRHDRTAVVIATLAVLALLVTAATVGTAEAASAESAATTDDATATYFDQPAVVVELSADGSATVTTVYTYDLTTDDERAAFRSLEEDDEAIANLTARYRDRLRRVAASAENETGREMSIAGVTAQVRTVDDGDTGVVALSATWDGIAAVDGDRLTVTEPFASGFEADRRVLLVAPDGHRLAAGTPSPDAVTDGRLEWSAGSDLAGFEVTFEPDPTATTAAGDTTEADGETTATDGAGDGTTDAGDDTAGDGTTTAAGGTDSDDTGETGSPGPGVVGALLATLLCLLLVRRRR